MPARWLKIGLRRSFPLRRESRARDLQEVLSRYEGTIEGFAAAFPYQRIDPEQFRTYAKNVFPRQQRAAIGV